MGGGGCTGGVAVDGVAVAAGHDIYFDVSSLICCVVCCCVRLLFRLVMRGEREAVL